MIDLKRDYGIVTGDPKIKFVQDNKYYDSRGMEIIERGPEVLKQLHWKTRQKLEREASRAN